MGRWEDSNDKSYSVKGYYKFFQYLLTDCYSNAIDYFCFMFLYQTSLLLNDYWGWDVINSDDNFQYIKTNIYEDFNKKFSKKYYKFVSYAFRNLFPKTYYKAKSKISIWDRFLLVVPSKFEHSLLAREISMILDKDENYEAWDKEEINNFFTFLSTKYIKKLKDLRFRTKTAFIYHILQDFFGQYQMFNMKEVDHIDFYTADIDCPNTFISRIPIDYSLRCGNFSYDIFKTIGLKDVPKDITNKDEVIFSIFKTIIYSLLSGIEYESSGMSLFGFILPSFKARIDILMTYFYEVTFKDGEKRLYLNLTEGVAQKELKVGDTADSQSLYSTICVFDEDKKKIDSFSKENISFTYNGNIDDFVNEFRYYCGYLIPYANKTRKSYTYYPDSKSVKLDRGFINDYSE